MDGVPLWSGLGVAPQAWTAYTSPTFQGTTTDPKGSTLLCLACHDASDGESHALSDTAGDLATTHPIEFSYDNALVLADLELENPATKVSGLPGGGHIEDDLLFDDNGQDNTMNCVTCHEIHIQGISEVAVPYDSDDDDVDDSEHDLMAPYLQPIPGIEFKVGHGGDATVADDWALNYGALCKLCHIK
jgi:hypothetical protein